jgi:sugar phosphate permease
MLGDRFHASRTIIVLFALLLLSDLFFALTTPIPGAAWIMLGNTLLTCIAIFGFRGLYFALFEEASVPPAVTGTAVGFVSVVGYTPDIFVTFVAGLLIDASPGLAGHQHFFLFLSAFALLGLIAAFVLSRHVQPSGEPLSVSMASGR